MNRVHVLALSVAAIAVAACTETPTGTHDLKVNTAAMSVSQSGRIELATVHYQEPLIWQPSDADKAVVTRDARGGTQGAPDKNILYWSGSVIRDQKVVAIYYSPATVYTNGPQAGTAGGATSDGSLIGHFLRNIGGTPYWNINTTYYQNHGGNLEYVNNTMGYSGFWADNQDVTVDYGPPIGKKTYSAPVAGGPAIDGLWMAYVVEQGFATGAITYDPNTVYMIFTGSGVNLGGGFSKSNLQYCAWHSAYRAGDGRIVQYSAMPYDADFTPAHRADNGGYCVPQNGAPNGDVGADGTVSAMTHEIEETATDPVSLWDKKFFYGWYDVTFGENADKCAYTYGPNIYRTSTGAYNLVVGGKPFLVQQNWSNVKVEGCLLSR